MDDCIALSEVPVVSSYTAADAIGDGVLIDLAPQPSILPINQIGSMDDYLKNYGAILGRKAIHALNPLHVPGRDPLLDFEDALREPFPCQRHVITAAVKMLDTVGSGFVVGEMGTGKTLLGMLSAHEHARRSRRQGGSNGKYRAIVLCPDHLIGKWVREIEETIPDAVVSRFGPQGSGGSKPKKRKKGEPAEETGTKATLRDIVALLDKSRGRHWEKPKGAEWYVLGRNQAKWLSDWAGLADVTKGFRHAPIGGEATPGLKANAVSSKSVVIDRIAKVDEYGVPFYDKGGYPLKTNVTARVYYCPSCGTVARDKKGVPLGIKDLCSGVKAASQKTCRGTYAEIVPDPEKPEIRANDIMCPVLGRFADKKPDQEFNHGGFKWIVKECKEPLWNYTSRPYRWSPARIIQRKLKRMFKYLVIDEVHEQKSDESAQSMACSKLIGAVDHVLALTGTIIGGYANHLYPLLMRIAPKSLIEEGFEWGKDMAFSEAYGRIDRIVTTKEEDDSGPSIRGNAKSMRRAKSGSRTERKAVRPGVMPQMFGRHMIGSSMFITLEELADELPDLFEYVGGPLACPVAGMSEDEKDHWERMEAGWFDTACGMEPAQADEYKRIMSVLEFANKELLRKGSMKLLGTYLWTGLDYPDRPFGWGHDPEVLKAYKLATEHAAGQAACQDGYANPEDYKIKLGHTVGFWDKPGVRTIDNFVGVVTPKDCPEDVVYPKEQKLVDICLKQKADGRQTWVYVQMSGKRNIQPRLKALLEARGLKVGVLRADDVEPIEREEWIAKHGRDFDVMISHPQLVSTGLDLFSKKQGGHNYSTLVFYETGYNLFTMRQAARRAWRIGQPHDCRVYYLYYKETMQHKAMALMSKKLAAAQALEGEFSADGLAAMAGEDNLQMALAKNLSERIDDADMQRSWGKVKSGPKKVKRPTSAVAAMTPKPVKESPLDHLPIEMQIVAESLIESQAKPVPPAAAAEFPGLREKLAALDAAFDKMEGFEPEPKEEKTEGGIVLPWEGPIDPNEQGIEPPAYDVEPDLGVGKEEPRLTIYSEPDDGLADFLKEAGLEESIELTDRDMDRFLAATADASEYDATFDEVVDHDVPELTEEILAKMFANMMANGIKVG